jgi:hypothetical protein
LVGQFTAAVRDERAGNPATPARGKRVELKTPRFDGTGDVHLFLKQFAEVSALSGWDNHVTLVQLRGFLDKGAKDCGRGDTVQGVYRRLRNMYGLSSSEARERLHSLKRDANESYLSLGNRVERLSRIAYGDLGSEIEAKMSLEHFDRALGDTALRQHLLVVRARSLEEAIKAAEQYALVSRQPPQQPGARGNHAWVGQVESIPASLAHVGVAEENSQSHMHGGKVEELLQSMVITLKQQGELIKEQSARIVSLERSKADRSSWDASSGGRNGDRRCFKCGDPSHFKRDCPQWKNSQASGQGKGSTTPGSENH